MSVASPQSGIPIDEKVLAPHAAEAGQMLRQVTGRIPVSPHYGKPGDNAGLILSSGLPPSDETVSIVEIAQKVSGDPVLLAEGVSHTLGKLKKAIQIGIYLAQQYGRLSGLDGLIEKNKTSRLEGVERGELTHKTTTASAIALFTASYYLSWSLLRYRPEELGALALQNPAVPQISLVAPRSALTGFVFWLGQRLQVSDASSSDLAFAKATLELAKLIAEDVVVRKDVFKYSEPFADVTYRLVGTDFSINGFSTDLSGGQQSVEFRRISFDEIVGNRDAKHAARRLAERLICYDPVAKDNPFRKLGGLSRIALGHGEPGTGKSMIIAATATILDEFCKAIGLPFLFHPLPDTVVSTFQGGSAERMVEWFRPLSDPSKIVYAPIDDAESNFRNRTHQGISAGVQEVIGVFLRNTEGAYAIDRGNTAIHLFTNLADQIDPAVLSRVLERFYIGGAQTREDFLDQDFIWWKTYRAMDEKFISLGDPPKYDYLAHQKAASSLGSFYKDYTEPKEAVVRELLLRADTHEKRGTQAWFSALYVETKKEYKLFTSRDVRNIQSAVSSRIIDFNLPKEWLEKPEQFFQKPFDEKTKLLIGLVKENMGTLKFGDVRFQEAIRYLDSMVRISDTGFERAVTEEMNRLKVVVEARGRFDRKIA